jgi:secreted trypsin-like serine protease
MIVSHGRRLAIAAGALLALAALPAPAGAVVSRDVKILGGAEAAPGQFPWMAALVDADARDAAKGIFCGGTVIAPRVVITAGHCVQGTDPGELDVVVGRTRLSRDTDGQRVAVTRIVRAPSWNSGTLAGDAALLQLAAPVAVTPLAVAGPADAARQAAGQSLIVSGWGATAEGGAVSDQLKYVRLRVHTSAKCEALFGALDGAKTVCAGSKRAGEDSCQGDSGGPLFFGDGAAARLVGIVSFGDGCGHADTPGVYTRASAYSAWIAQESAVLNGDAPAPPVAVKPPTVRIGRIACGPSSCTVSLSVTGRAPAGGIVLNVVRKRSGGRKGVDRFVFARGSGTGRWTATTNLPFGKLTLYAIPLTKAQDDLDGNGDVERIEIVPA